MKVLLTRFDSSDQGVFGRIEAPGGFRLFTGELPWRDNETNISCIPVGVYECRWTWSARFKRFMYEVKVPGRVGVRIHPANLMGDRDKGFKAQLNGCIALGEHLGFMEGQKAILVSKPAIRAFEAHMAHLPFELEIREWIG